MSSLFFFPCLTLYVRGNEKEHARRMSEKVASVPDSIPVTECGAREC